MVTPKKRCEVDGVFDLLKAGFGKKQIKEKLGLKDTALSNHLRRLEENNKIKRVGKYQITIISTSPLHPTVTKNKLHIGFNKRGHAHNFTIHFSKKIDLLKLPKVRQDKALKILQELKFGSLKFVKNGFTIWINKNNLTFYSNNSYYSKDALHSKFYALRDADTLVENLILKYNFPKSYGIEVFREHYGLIFNDFAKWLIKQNKKLYVKERGNKTILWVDKSRKDDIGLQEFEGEDPIKINNADTFFDSHQKHGFKVDADYILKNKEMTDQKLQGHDQVIEKSMQVLQGYAEQIALHLEVEKEQLITQKKMQKTLDEIHAHTKSKDL